MQINLGLNMVSESTRRRGDQNNPARHTAAGYAAVYPTAHAVQSIVGTLNEIGLDTDFDMSDLHVTLMYDKSNPTFFHPAPVNLIYVARVVGADLFGDEKNTLVLKLDCAALQKRHKYLLSVGYRFSYPDYAPHITIKIPATQEDLDLVLNAINHGAFSEELELGGEKWDAIKEKAYAKYEGDEEDDAEEKVEVHAKTPIKVTW